MPKDKQINLKKEDPVITDLLSDEVEVASNQSSFKEEYLEEYSKQIFSRDNIEVKTDLESKHINPLNIAMLYADEYDVPILTKYCNTFMVLRVSNKRQSRKEYTDSIKSVMNTEERLPTMADRFLGR